MEFMPWRIAVSRKDGTPDAAAAGLFSAVLKARGLEEPEAARAFLEEAGPLYDPMLLPDMDKAVERVRRAIDGGEKILVYGDYDCDGVTATVLLYDYLENAGADVLYYIPEREGEGYGLNQAVIHRMKEAGVQLIITVDNGVTAVEEIACAAAQGMDVVVTDHHRPGEVLPDAAAVVDPHRQDSVYPFPDLCGAGVAFKLICALEGDTEGMLLEHYGDLLAISTVADMVPLQGENRRLVGVGLAQLRESENTGLRILMKRSGLEPHRVDSERIAFDIAPRLNVAGRIGSVDEAVELLLCQSENEAWELAERICALNDRRKELEGEIIRDIQQILEGDPCLLERRVLVLCGKRWHQGVVGIIAARLVERYKKPCILLSGIDEEMRGSARSVEGFSIVEAIRSKQELLIKCGGHPMAAGLSIERKNLLEFLQGVEDYARENYPVMPVPTLKVDTTMQPGEITLENIRQLDRLEPFGCENPRPVLALLGVRLGKIAPMGKEKNHLRLTLEQGGVSFQAVLFGVGPESFPLEEGELADCAVSLRVNTYNNLESPQARILSIRPHGFDMDAKLRLGAAYQGLRRGEEPQNCREGEMDFSREDLGTVFRWLRGHSPWQKGTDMLAHRLRDVVHYGKVLAALDILCELGLISRKMQRGIETIQVLPAKKKAELTDSPTYRLLQQRGGA